jgi:hypothetical protein
MINGIDEDFFMLGENKIKISLKVHRNLSFCAIVSPIRNSFFFFLTAKFDARNCVVGNETIIKVIITIINKRFNNKLPCPDAVYFMIPK